jgi:hypothetical protein
MPRIAPTAARIATVKEVEAESLKNLLYLVNEFLH